MWFRMVFFFSSSVLHVPFDFLKIRHFPHRLSVVEFSISSFSHADEEGEVSRFLVSKGHKL